MKCLRHLLWIVAISLVLVPTAAAQTTATQNVTVVVEAVAAVSVSAGSLSLTLNSATPGSDLTSATDNSTTYSLTTNGTTTKISAALDGAYADGISLAVELAAPTGASSVQQTLSTTSQDLVTGISKLKATGLGITYTASATPAAVANGAGEMQTVTFTITH